MKKVYSHTVIAVCIFTFALCPLTSYVSFGQSPQGINYQAVARDASGNPLVSTTLSTVNYKIRQGAFNGAIVYEENYSNVLTNQFGLFSLVIGQGTIVSGAFNSISWGANTYWLDVTVNGNNMGATQFMSVPYSLYSLNGAPGATGPTGAIGTTGTAGTNGITGPTGTAGTNGTNGVTGPTGTAGTNGTNGITGPTGIAGTNGTNGITGPTGIAGTNGTNGVTGPTGIAGTNGTNGVTGPTGLAGTNGTNGITGPTGIAGTNGTNGVTGPTGIAGTNGTNGITGSTGLTGSAGTNGTNGITGPTGTAGITGPTGTFGVVGTTGQTIYHNGTTWINTSNLYNDGTNVGIGTISPTAKLDIVSNSFDLLNLTTTLANTNVNVVMNTTGAGAAQFQQAGGTGGFTFYPQGVVSPATLAIVPSGTTGNVGIGTTTPNASSILDITSTSKGLLIPRVSLISTGDVATITSPATSLLVYNTNAAMGGGGLGYWFWDGTKWIQLLNGGSPGSAWSTTGNAGTVDATNFIGTTDNVPLNFKVNGQKAGRIDANLANTFFGYVAGSTTTGSSNTAIGYYALWSNNTGANNTASGTSALFTNTIGNNNTALGTNADVTLNNLSNATAIGYNAKVSASNSLVLGGTGANAVNVGIGTATPTYPLHVTSPSAANIFAANIENTNANGWGLSIRNTNIDNTKLALATYNNTNTRYDFVVTNAGNAGLGITVPEALFHVRKNGGVGISNLQLGNANQPTREWMFDVDGSANLYINNEGAGTPFTSMFFDNTGKVGIGTTTPSAKLHTVLSTTASVNAIQIDYTNTASGAGNRGGLFITHSANHPAGGIASHGIFINSTNAGLGSIIGLGAYISGNTGEKRGLDISASGSGTNVGMLVDASGGTTNTGGYFNASGGATNYAIIVPSTGGNVGIGTTAPTAKLDVAGQVKIADGTEGVGKVLTSDNTGLASWQSPAFTNASVFNTTGNFTVPAGVTKIMVEVWGAGGGGGAYAKDFLSVVPAAVIPVTVGTGGVGAGAGGGSGINGTASSISTITANGGTGGTTTAGGAGGIAGAALITVAGGGGYNGLNVATTFPHGGDAGVGGTGGRFLTTTGAGSMGVAPGGGGSGANGGFVGGNGANGRVIVWW